jgi:signal transduction histidine kinase
LCAERSRSSMAGVQVQDALEAEQARYIHRSVPTAALGGLLVVVLVVLVFRPVVDARYLYAWLGAFLVLTVVRAPGWLKYRKQGLSPANARRWLRHAVAGSLVSGVLWGLGTLFLIPEGQAIYQLIFPVAVLFMTVAAMFSYAPHNPTFLVFMVPAAVPSIVGLALVGGAVQISFAIGLVNISMVVLWSRVQYNRMFVETMRLRFENVDLVAQLTEQKETAEAANLAKSRFLAAASHDLRQPIHALNLYLGAFAQIQLPRQAGSLLTKVRQCAHIMDEMFRTLLDISKLDAGAVKAQVCTFALAPMLARAKLEFEPQARVKGLRLRVVRSSAHAKSDPVLVERILRNLISNAIRYTERGGVVVGCRNHRGTIRVCVYDTGVGIEPAEQSLVFEEFYQVGNKERDRSKGLGLGLAIVERLAKLLDAPVTLLSRKGRGSLFAFDLQPGGAPELPVVGAPRTRGRRRNLAGTLVVVVDDEELILDAAQTLLTQWNCSVIAATSGHDALRQLADSLRPPDVLICDYRLRDEENGIGVVEAIRNEFNTEIPALLITGDTDPEQIRRITASGLALLHKPLSEDELHDAICALGKPPAPAVRH